MKVNNLSFGSVMIDGITYEKDVVIDGGQVRKRKKGESKKYREDYGHTPLSHRENIPWECKKLVIGTGHSGALPVMKQVFEMAKQKGVEIITMKTPKAVEHVNDKDTNLILHLTC